MKPENRYFNALFNYLYNTHWPLCHCFICTALFIWPCQKITMALQTLQHHSPTFSSSVLISVLCCVVWFIFSPSRTHTALHILFWQLKSPVSRRLKCLAPSQIFWCAVRRECLLLLSFRAFPRLTFPLKSCWYYIDDVDWKHGCSKSLVPFTLSWPAASHGDVIAMEIRVVTTGVQEGRLVTWFTSRFK